MPGGSGLGPGPEPGRSRGGAGLDLADEPQLAKRSRTTEDGSGDEPFSKGSTDEAVATAALDDYAEDYSLRRVHVVLLDLPVCKLDCSAAWGGLTEQEKRYAHHFSMAAWAGALICPKQLSPESPGIFKLLLLLFSGQPISQLKAASLENGVTDRQWRYFLTYASCFLSNMGNYLSFGDSKMIPGLPMKQLGKIIEASDLEEVKKEKLRKLWQAVSRGLYALRPCDRELGLFPDGVSNYYGGEMTREEISVVQEWMQSKGVEAWNTRLWKLSGPSSADNLKKSGSPTAGCSYELRIASAETRPSATHEYKDCVITLTWGDHKEELIKVVEHLKDCSKYTANDLQQQMIECYMEHFRTGSVDAHKDSQRLWIQDRSPVVETNIGFIETYRDPLGSRAEFEGFVAVVNKTQTAKFAALVQSAEALLPTLPWPREFEKDHFLQPDFTSLDVVSYASSGIPAGINIPNYDDIRQTSGFKNVSLGNVLSTQEGDEHITFICEEDQLLFKSLKAQAFEVQVGCHELLGHGSGKLFMQAKDGSYNFPHGQLKHPYGGEPVTRCYGPGQSWDSVFGSIGSSFEECRAESVGIFLSTEPTVLEIFGHPGSRGEDIMYVNWLLMVRAGLLATEFYSLDTKSWRQAHMQARFAILQVLLAASAADATKNQDLQGEKFRPFLEIRRLRENDAQVRLERDKIRSVGVPAISELLTKLQVYKATADYEASQQLYGIHSALTLWAYELMSETCLVNLVQLCRLGHEFVDLRRLVIAKKRPRPIFVQVHTVVEPGDDGKVQLQEFDAMPEGVIQSFLTRFKSWIGTIC
eukprot:SM000276S10286  [mRNA]  locus=s276:43798:50772:+ [translate_table: standard]